MKLYPKSKLGHSLFRIFGTVFLVSALFIVAMRTTEYFTLLYYKKNPELIMKDIPFYTVIEKHDPALFSQIRQDIKEALDNQTPPKLLKVKVRAYLDKVLSEKLPSTSNQAIINYMSVTVQEMQSLQQQGYGLCHKFLYPKPGQLVDLTQYVPSSLIDQDLSSLTEVIRNAYENPSEVPTVQEVRPLLKQVYDALEKQYGVEVQALMRPLDEYTNKDTVCAMTIAMFQEILKLPVEQGGQTFRFLVLKNNGS